MLKPINTFIGTCQVFFLVFSTQQMIKDRGGKIRKTSGSEEKGNIRRAQLITLIGKKKGFLSRRQENSGLEIMLDKNQSLKNGGIN